MTCQDEFYIQGEKRFSLTQIYWRRLANRLLCKIRTVMKESPVGNHDPVTIAVSLMYRSSRVK